jgi:hypothetical protein
MDALNDGLTMDGLPMDASLNNGWLTDGRPLNDGLFSKIQIQFIIKELGSKSNGIPFSQANPTLTLTLTLTLANALSLTPNPSDMS